MKRVWGLILFTSIAFADTNVSVVYDNLDDFYVHLRDRPICGHFLKPRIIPRLRLPPMQSKSTRSINDIEHSHWTTVLTQIMAVGSAPNKDAIETSLVELPNKSIEHRKEVLLVYFKLQILFLRAPETVKQLYMLCLNTPDALRIEIEDAGGLLDLSGKVSDTVKNVILSFVEFQSDEIILNKLLLKPVHPTPLIQKTQ